MAEKFNVYDFVKKPEEIPVSHTPTNDAIQAKVSQEPAELPKTKDQWRFDENAFRLGGAMIGGTVATPGGPLAMLVGSGLGQEAGGRGAQILNGFLYDNQEILPQDVMTGAVDLSQKTMESGVNIITDMMLGGLFSKVGNTVSKIPRGIFGEEYNRLAKVTTAKLGDLYNTYGVPKSAGAFGGPIVKGSEVALSKLPTSAKVVQKSIDSTVEGVGSSLDDVISDTGVVKSTEVIGRELKGNVNSWIQSMRGQVSKRYMDVGKKIPNNPDIPMKNTLAAIEGMTGGTASELKEIRRIQFPAEMKNILSAINKETKFTVANTTLTNKASGTLSWKDASQLNTGLGAKIGDPNVNTKTPKNMLKKISAAIMTDMESAAQKFGPEAKEAWEEARNFTRLFHQKKEIVSSIANSNLGRDAFDAAITKSTRTPEILRELKTIVKSVDNKMGTEVWNDFVATHLFEFSRATPVNQSASSIADFSIHTFLKNYNSLSKSGSSKILFSGIPGLEGSLKNLSQISSSIKDVSRFANPSGTASQNQFMNVLTGRILLAGAGGAVGTEFSEEPTGGFVKGAAVALIAPWAFGKLITNKPFVNWLSQGVRIKPADVNGIAAHMGRLVGITKASPEIRDAVFEYLDVFKAQNERDAIIKSNFEPSGIPESRK